MIIRGSHKLIKRLELSYKNLEKLLDTQANIVILTNGKELKFANRKFFEFLNFENLEKFKETNKKIFQSLIYFSPLFFVIFLGGFLSYKDYSETIVGTTILVCTIGSMTIMGTWLIKRTY